MAKKQFKHLRINPSIHNIDCINGYLKRGWILKSIHYADPDYDWNRIVPPGHYSDSMIVRFIKPILPEQPNI